MPAPNPTDLLDAVVPPAASDSLRELSPDQAYDDIVLLAASVCDAPAAAIWLFDQRHPRSIAQRGTDYLQSPCAQVVCNAVRAAPDQMLLIADVAGDPRFRAAPARIGQPPLRFYAGVPLARTDGRLLGVVCVMDVRPRQLSATQLAGLAALARQTRHLLELHRQALQQERRLREGAASTRRAEQARVELEARHQDLQRSAGRDQLTGLLNRTAWAQLRDDPLALAKLQRSAYSLVVLDVDHFKQVNDRHGHSLGDRALQVVADAVRASVRDDDVAVRYGGEEFLVVLPDTGLAGAYEVAHRIRERVAASSLPFALTVSAGVAAANPACDRPEQVFDRADQALYRAKANGRDQVVADDTPQHGR